MLEERFATLIEDYDEGGELDRLVEAADIADAVEPEADLSESGIREFRASKLALWIIVLNRIDDRLEPDFDFEDTPDLSVAPPPESGLPAGVDPAGIKDPEMRQQYEQDVAANQEKAAAHRLQSRLHRINEEATVRAETHLSTYFTGTDSDQAELEEILAEQVQSERRQASLGEFCRALP